MFSDDNDKPYGDNSAAVSKELLLNKLLAYNATEQEKRITRKAAVRAISVQVLGALSGCLLAYQIGIWYGINRSSQAEYAVSVV